MGTIACTQHAQANNGFHDPYDGHVDFQQWLGQLEPKRPVHCAL